MIILIEATDIQRHASGQINAYKMGKEIARFNTEKAFRNFVDKHYDELGDNVVPFSGSASLNGACLDYMALKRINSV